MERDQNTRGLEDEGQKAAGVEEMITGRKGEEEEEEEVERG